MSERDQEVNRQIAALGAYKLRLMRQSDEIWARVKTAYNERFDRDEKKPTAKQRAELDRLAIEIANCERSQNALFSVR